MSIKEEIQKQKELLYLNSLKVSNNILSEALDEALEVSSGLLSSAASLLKLNPNDVVEEKLGDDFSLRVKGLIEDAVQEKKEPTKEG